jgi:NADPH-dependent 2,4-dienoyl-CoA reductase/sulfur reductase-like enzyme
MTPHDILIIGASVAGVRLAQTLRRRKYPGHIRLLDAEPGLPYDKPALSKEVLAAEGPQADPPVLIDENQLTALDIELLQGCPAESMDTAAKTVRTPAGELAFTTAVIATGATPRTLPTFADLDGVHYLRSRADAEGLRVALENTRHLAVVGGGFIGGEVASSARSRGIEVTIIEAAPRLLARTMPAEVAHEVAELHRANGVSLELGKSVSYAVGEGQIDQIVLSDGRTLEVDTLVVGIGARPETDWLEGSGLHLDDGILCEPDLRAEGASDIFAIGDVARWRDPHTGEYRRLEHWTAAREQAALVATNICAEASTAFTTTEYIWSDQHGVRIQHVGHIGSSLTRTSNKQGGLLFTHFAGAEIVGATGFDASHELLGVRQRLTAAALDRRTQASTGPVSGR